MLTVKDNPTNKKGPRILIISLDPVILKGDLPAPSFYLTLARFIEKGFKVHYLGPVMESQKSINPMFNGLEIHELKPPLKITHKKLFELPQRPGFLTKNLFRILRYLLWIVSTIVSIIRGAFVIAKNDIDVIYALTPLAVPSGYVLKKIFRVKCVNRLFGTQDAYSHINDPHFKIKYFDKYLAFKAGCDAYIMVDDGTRSDEVAKAFGVPPEKLNFWKNGYDHRLMGNNNNIYERLGSGEISILSTSRLDKPKGVHHIIEAMPDIIRLFPRCRLIIVGDGPEDANLKQLARLKSVDQNVSFVGKVSWNDTRHYYQEAVLHISLADQSNLGNSLIEALASGCCVIALDSGDTGKAVKDGYNGRLISKDDLYDLSGIINKLLNQPELVEVLSSNAMEFIKNNFETWDSRIDKEIQLLKKLSNGSVL